MFLQILNYYYIKRLHISLYCSLTGFFIRSGFIFFSNLIDLLETMRTVWHTFTSSNILFHSLFHDLDIILTVEYCSILLDTTSLTVQTKVFVKMAFYLSVTSLYFLYCFIPYWIHNLKCKLQKREPDWKYNTLLS